MQLTYFPYLRMDNVPELLLKELGVRVWNYSKKADDYISDPLLRTTLDSIMAMNVTHWTSIEDMGIVTVGDCDWREYTEDERELCREARLLLFIGAISYGGTLGRGSNSASRMFTSENFIMMRQGFESGGENMATEDGYIVRKWSAGHKISETKFIQPGYTPEPIAFKLDGEVIMDLMKLRKYNKRLYRRCMRAIDVLMQAYYNDTKLSEQARILLIASAYEILFNLPSSKQRKALKEVFENYFVQTSDIKRRYSSQRANIKGFVWETESIKVMWADKFYTLRSKIIHGETIKKEDYTFTDKQHHFDIAVLFFVLGLKKIIGETRYVKQTSDEIVWCTETEVGWAGDSHASEHTYEGFVYKDMWFL